MSQQLEMTIIARDQASRVVNQVQKKVMDFGKDIGRSIAAVAGPMALATMAFGKISAHFEKMAQLRKEAFDWGASLSGSAEKLGVTAEQFQDIEAAADKTGKSVDDIAKAFKSVEQRIAEAQRGNKDAIDSFKALGFTAEEIKTLKPEDVLKRLGDALSTVQDPAKRAELAITALGGSAKGLQDVLAKGFDIAGAFQDKEGLTDEEAAFLRETAKKEREKQNREKLRIASKGATEEALKDPEIMKEVSRDVFGMSEADQSKMPLDPAALAQNELAQKKVREILARRAKEKQDAEAARIAASGGAETAGDLEDLRKKREADAAAAKAAKEASEKAEKERIADKERKDRSLEAQARKAADDFAKQAEKDLFGKEKGGDKEKAMKPLEVSSLRAIGGGLAGEAMGGGAVDIAKQQLDTQKQMVEKLDGILKMQAPPTNQFTNPDTTSGRFGIGVA
jgi:hypothetical protein